MTMIPTLRGDVDVATLGMTLMHEHIYMASPDVRSAFPGRYDPAKEHDDAVRKLNLMANAGVKTIADCSVLGHGRDIHRMIAVAKETELNIIPATGMYSHNELPGWARFEGPDTVFGGEEFLTQLFIGDLRDGIEGTDVRAAFLKCSIDHYGLTDGVERIMRAVAQASVETGAPITVHTNPLHHTGTDALRVLIEEGVNPQKVVLGHSGDSTDLDHLRSLMDDGATLGMDRFGLEHILSTSERVNTVAQLCAMGYADRMVLSHDACGFIDWFPAGWEEQWPNWHFLHIPQVVPPALREAGVDEAALSMMLIDNPARYFASN
jgi:phosphotriesterase-related protein